MEGTVMQVFIEGFNHYFIKPTNMVNKKSLQSVLT